MKLLSIIHGPVYGGAHTQLLRLREPLRARGWDTVALVPDEPGNGRDRLAAEEVEVIQMPLHRLRATPNPATQAAFLAGFRREVGALRGVIRRHDIDLVQVHGPTNPHGALAAHLEGVAVVWQIYDTVAPMPLRHLTMPLVTRLADAITVWGMELARSHPGATSLGERLIPVFPPVDAAQFEPTEERRAAARARLGVPDGAALVGTVGVRNPSKGHQYLVRAAALVREQRDDAVFRVLGSPSPVHAAHEASVRAEATAHGLADPALLDFVDPNGDVPRLVPGFDVFVMSSVPRSEGIPTAILEAMACGLPVVSTDVGAVREIVEDGVTGFVVRPEEPGSIAEALLRLLGDPDLRREMGAEARRRALERYDLESLAALHLRAYETALEYRRSRA